MRLRLAYFLAWGIATTVVAGASWLGVRAVLTAPQQTRSGSASLPTRAAPPPVAPAATTARTGSRLPSVAPAAGAPAAPGWTAVPNGRGGTAFRRTFRTTGGDVSVWCEPGSARVQEAVPKAGYTVDVTRLAVDAVQVSFVHERQASRLLVRWWDAPYAELTESVG